MKDKYPRLKAPINGWSDRERFALFTLLPHPGMVGIGHPGMLGIAWRRCQGVQDTDWEHTAPRASSAPTTTVGAASPAVPSQGMRGRIHRLGWEAMGWKSAADAWCETSGLATAGTGASSSGKTWQRAQPAPSPAELPAGPFLPSPSLPPPQPQDALTDRSQALPALITIIKFYSALF